MSSNDRSPLNIPELLDSILRHLPARELLTNTQRVSRDWNATINLTPILRQQQYLNPSQRVPEGVRYVKNELAAFRIPDIFGVRYTFTRGVWKFRHVKPAKVSSTRLRRSIRGEWYDWTRSDHKWRNLQVAIPPITKVRWEVMREDREENDTLPFALPDAIAELHFPEGLRVGQLWDIIRITKGVHRIFWPSVTPGTLRRPALVGDREDDWLSQEAYNADSSYTLVLQHRIVHEDDYDTEEEESENDEGGEDNGISPDMHVSIGLKPLLRRHNIQIQSLSVLAYDEEDGDWIYAKVNGDLVRRFTVFAQTPYEPLGFNVQPIDGSDDEMDVDSEEDSDED
ncbi:hypothetical protein F5Y05DRAFT_410642 [Hypoxylon sp. FL0543]|nr:hypothetical protein F5Y05DRAFT_410642 [Hypoxylon sp. FL0543]